MKNVKRVSAFSAFSTKIKAAGQVVSKGQRRPETRHKKTAKRLCRDKPKARIPSTLTRGKQAVPQRSTRMTAVKTSPVEVVRKSLPNTSSSSKEHQKETAPPRRKKLETPVELLTTLLHDLPAPHSDSTAEAEKLFRWLISPVIPEDFFNGLWEKKPLLLRRHMPSYNDGLFSSAELHRILQENDLDFTTNIDITTYSDGQRETHNPVGRAHPSVVWDFYKNDCSVRLLNPQTYSDSVWKLNSILQEYFGSFVGANVYLTPAGTQGFAPHYDDIEAFVLQIEGRKNWRLYNPRSPQEVLPRVSSRNFSQDEIGQPILDIDLEPGDLLYFPRGTIHQARTLKESHSLHMTLSTCQRNTWGDLLKKLVPRSLDVALKNDTELRQSLPRDYMKYMGFVNKDCPERVAFFQKIGELMVRLATSAPVDEAVDQVAKGFIHDSLPPKLTQEEISCSIFGDPLSFSNGKASQEIQIMEDTEVRITRRGVARLVRADEQVCIYHTLENSRVYHGKEVQFIEVPGEAAQAIEYLSHVYPKFTQVRQLPLDGELEGKQEELIQVLYERGIIVTREPLKPV